MKNPELKQRYLETCTEFTKEIMEQAIELEGSFGKDICDLGYTEANELIGKIKGDRESIIDVLSDYTDYAVSQNYSRHIMNIFRMI